MQWLSVSWEKLCWLKPKYLVGALSLGAEATSEGEEIYPREWAVAEWRGWRIFHFNVQSYITQIFFLFLILQPSSPCLGLVLRHIASLCRRWWSGAQKGLVDVVRRQFGEARWVVKNKYTSQKSWSCMQMLCLHTHKATEKKQHFDWRE